MGKKNLKFIFAALKEPFNKHFGSVFRTHNNPTMFAHGLQQYLFLFLFYFTVIFFLFTDPLLCISMCFIFAFLFLSLFFDKVKDMQICIRAK